MGYRTSLNLKSDDAYRLARELSERTGESMTKAVVVALQERLDRLGRETRQSRIERILAISRAYAAELTDAERAIDHDELLYDPKTGLPRDC